VLIRFHKKLSYGRCKPDRHVWSLDYEIYRKFCIACGADYDNPA